MNISNILDVIARKVTVVKVVHCGLGVPSCSCLLPNGLYSSTITGDEDVAIGKSIEFFKVFSSSFTFKSLK